MKTKDYLNKFTEFKTQTAKARKIFSPVEYAKFEKAQRAEYDKLAAAVLPDVQKEYADIYKAFTNAKQAEAEARENFRNGLDYQRLNYAQEAVKAALAGARNGQEAAKAYEAARGDRYKVLAWGEVGAGLLDGKQIDLVEKSTLTSRIKADYAEASTTPEIQKAAETVTAKGWEAWQFQSELIDTANTLDANGYGFTTIQLQSLASNINREVKTNERGGYDATFTLEPEKLNGY
jgi:hypothetical protein